MLVNPFIRNPRTHRINKHTTPLWRRTGAWPQWQSQRRKSCLHESPNLRSKQEQKKTGTMSFKVSEKGGVSVYGLGPFPVTLYYEHGPGSWMQGRTCGPSGGKQKSSLKLKT